MTDNILISDMNAVSSVFKASLLCYDSLMLLAWEDHFLFAKFSIFSSSGPISLSFMQ